VWIVRVGHVRMVLILLDGGGVGADAEKSAGDGDGWIAPRPTMMPDDYPCGRFDHDVLLEK